MKTSKKLITPSFSWRVKSRSQSGYHIVGWDEGEVWSCDCIAGMMKQSCRHIRIVQNKLKGLTDENH